MYIYIYIYIYTYIYTYNPYIMLYHNPWEGLLGVAVCSISGQLLMTKGFQEYIYYIYIIYIYIYIYGQLLMTKGFQESDRVCVTTISCNVYYDMIYYNTIV